ncbi:MAG: response regulator transcription factor [Rhodanobacteraceae bacterium]|nr:response regulator transcription factor [Rhodanobacteraceae bacterium]
MTTSIRLLLVDDHAVVREGIRAVLEDFDEIHVVGEAGDGDSALAMLERTQPDLLLSDLKMPGLPASELVRRAMLARPALRVLMFTSFAEHAQVKSLLDAGAHGYLLKDAAREDIRRAINTVAQGQRYLHPLAEAALRGRVGHQGLERLTERERDVLLQVAEGHSNKEIGRKLNLTEGTVKGYVSAIFEKLGVNDRTQAALIAHRAGMTS